MRAVGVNRVFVPAGLGARALGWDTLYRTEVKEGRVKKG